VLAQVVLEGDRDDFPGIRHRAATDGDDQIGAALAGNCRGRKHGRTGRMRRDTVVHGRDTAFQRLLDQGDLLRFVSQR